MEVIDREYVVSHLRKLGSDRASSSHIKQQLRKLPPFALHIVVWCYKHFVDPVRRLYTWLVRRRRVVVPHGLAKSWSDSFLLYVLENPTCSLRVDWFPQEDWDEIRRFVDVRLLFATQPRVIKSQLLLEADAAVRKEYSLFEKKHVRGWSVRVGEEWFKLSSSVDTPLFFHEYGMKVLPSTVRDSLQGRVFVDVGAFIGDTCVLFSCFHPSRVIAFEPDKRNFSLLEQTIRMNDLCDVDLKNCGVGESAGELHFRGEGHAGSRVDDSGEVTIPVVTLDEEVSGDVGLIKMDIEGFETPALLGAKKTIIAHKPVLLICLYHSGRDFFEVPRLLREWVPEYSFRFCNLNHNHSFADKVLVAYVK